MDVSAITPLPLPPRPGTDPLRSVVLFGGSFDPPQIAHTRLPELIVPMLGPGTLVVFVPAARSPHKASGPIAPDEHRIAMLRLCAPGASVWTDEIDRASAGAASFAVDTARRARAWLDAHQLAGVTLRWLMGADQAVKFHLWREPQELARLAQPLVVLRFPQERPGELESTMRVTGAYSEADLVPWRSRVLTLPLIDASSTETRERLRRRSPEDLARLAHLLAPGVLDYIDQHRLYR